uniref:Uncharacterized protein n=1 Tax=Kalanchoe fedtschenkoi TaxID=63787 RepID=A0A7N0TIX9_KALFE
MEVDLEPRVKPLTYKVRAMSRESPAQKAAHVLDSDLRTHWSTGTNTKEWILLELQEPCLLSHIKIYNKSVLEWEISAGLRYKPETFVKVRPRCEAPRREMLYPMNYTPCRYVRISCLRGNPIAIFFIQLIGVSVASLEAEFQPVVEYLLPHIIAHKQDAHDMHLKLLEDITSRLQPFLSQLEADLTNFFDDAESNIRFLSMLSGPFYPLLHIVNEREYARTSTSGSDAEASKNSQSISILTVSSNFEPRKSRSTSPYGMHSSSATAFRPDAVILLLRKAYKDSNLRTICILASKIMEKLVDPIDMRGTPMPASCVSSDLEETSKSELPSTHILSDYSDIFGEEFRILDCPWDSSYLNILDIGVVEEGILHVLYASASQPLQCSKLADGTSDMWSALPLVQALLPVLRPHVSSPHNLDDAFSLWKQPLVQQALSQIVSTSSAVYRPLLHAAAGYLSSFSPSHVKAACILIDLCCGVLAPWMPEVTAKVDLAVELVEDLLGVFQDTRHSFARARAAIKYVVLALSGRVDDILARYKDVKHEILFLVQMLEPFLDPAIIPSSGTCELGAVSSSHAERGESSCDLALTIIRAAVQKPAVLPSLECEWRRGLVTPSVLLSVLDPHMKLPVEIDKCKSAFFKSSESEYLNVSPFSDTFGTGSPSSKTNCRDDPEAKMDVSDSALKMDTVEDMNLFFAPLELKALHLECPPDKIELSFSSSSDDREKILLNGNVISQVQNVLELDTSSIDHMNLQADYLHLNNYQKCELRASEFRHLALDLHSHSTITLEGHNAAIDALLLAAECYLNPFFLMSFRTNCVGANQSSSRKASIHQKFDITELRRVFERNYNLEMLAQTERKRDKYVIQLLLEAAILDKQYHEQLLTEEKGQTYAERFDESIIDLSQSDLDSADAITLVRQNQALLFNFLIHQFQRDQHSMHEILMQSLLFLLSSATELFCAPESIIDIILNSADYLNGMLTSFYYQLKEGNKQMEAAKVHEVQRRWMLLQKLVIVSSGNDHRSDTININNVSFCGNLFPASAWILRIPSFSKCASPLVRFLGWMAVSRNAKQYLRERLILTSDLAQLTNLLSIFSDELALIENAVSAKENVLNVQPGSNKYSKDYSDKTFCVLYPDLSKFFPQMKKQFESFGEIILESVGIKLRTLPTYVVPDMLCWFSDFCFCPFLQKDQISGLSNSDHWKGYVAKNAKAVILYTLEVIVTEHMEAIVPETPRIMQVLISICRSSYSDVSFLDSMLHLVRPIITFSLRKASYEEKLWVDDSCLNFESLCFDEFFHCIGRKSERHDATTYTDSKIALMIYLLATIFPDLSFNRKRELLLSLKLWADFASFEHTMRFHDYLAAFCVVMESCRTILRRTLDGFGVKPNHLTQYSEVKLESLDQKSENHGSDIPISWSLFLKDVNSNSSSAGTTKLLTSEIDGGVSYQKSSYSVTEDIENLRQDLESLVSVLNPSLELSWKFHGDLAKKLAIVYAECVVLWKCLSSIVKTTDVDDVSLSLPDSDDLDRFPVHWNAGIKGLTEVILALLDNHCWEVASVFLDCLLGMPQWINLDDALHSICFALRVFSGRAPKIAWRLQTDKWLSSIFAKGIQIFSEKESSLTDLFCSMLGHREPEQRYVALKHLGGLVNKHFHVMETVAFSATHDLQDSSGSIGERVLNTLVSSTWDQVVVMASSDTLTILRTRAVALLRDFCPFIDRRKLQSFLAAADNIFQVFGKFSNSSCDGLLIQLSLALICSACLHSPYEDLSLIPENVWRDIEDLGTLKNDRGIGDLEKKACQALCRLRNEGDVAKEVLKTVLSSNSSKELDPELQTTRESILQVLSNLTSVRSYFDIFSEKIDEDTMDIEEAEMELEILRKITEGQESSENHKARRHSTYPVGSDIKNSSRLQQIKDSIRSLEKAKIRDEIIRRRQNKTLVRQARQKRLEEAATREAELIQELDRERTIEVEREIERQRALEIERIKTRELRHNLEMEKERQLQRELQRELEQAESGVRSSRREYPSSGHGGRPKERFRERDSGRPGEGTMRVNGSNFQPESSNTAPAMVLPGSRTFSGQPPTILPRDRSDEAGSSYEENFEGSKDSGDTGSIGEFELGPTFDGQTSGYGPSQRQSSRGPKSRQMIVDKREREGRREGKWERKH